MKLRQLFESSANEVAMIFGRFNPPHKGHKAAWQLMSKSPLWFVGTNSNTQGPKDPLPFDVKVVAMKEIYPEIDGHLMSTTSWLTMASELYKKYKDAKLLVYTDEDWVTKTIKQYNGQENAHGYYNFSSIEQVATPRLSSATSLRDAVKNNDKEAFTAAAGVDADTMIGDSTYFDLVSKHLMPYAEKEKAKVKKKKDVDEGQFRSKDIEEKLIANDKLNDLKSKYLPDWEMLDHRILQAKYVAKDHRHAEEFVSYINKVSEEMDHFAEVTQDVAEVTVKTSTFDVKGLTILDFKLALKVDKYAESNEIEQVRMQGNFGMHESSYGRYWCSTDKKWKYRKGPKQSRKS